MTDVNKFLEQELINPIRTRADWNDIRSQCEKDLGGFHGAIAAKEMYWFHPAKKSWLRNDGESWVGWYAGNAKAIREQEWCPWTSALDESAAPYYHWFRGALTNAGFNEVDRHVLGGYGHEVAFYYEGDQWDPTLKGGMGGPVKFALLKRRDLLIQSVIAAQALKDLGLQKNDRIILNMPNTLEQIIWTEAAKRLGVIYSPVFGGFSEKTLSDRIESMEAKVVITTDGASRNAEIVRFKDGYSDPALDQFVGVKMACEAISSIDMPVGLGDQINTHLNDIFANEVTLTRAEIMREIGKVFDASGLDFEAGARLRVECANVLAAVRRSVEKVVVVKHVGLEDMAWDAERDCWAHDLLAAAEQTVLELAEVDSMATLQSLDSQSLVKALWKSNPPEPVSAEHPMFVIYTSGSTGKPKGVVHVHGGYLLGLIETMRVCFEAVPGKDVIYVVADPGWITGQSYMISAALAYRITSVIAEGAPTFPNAGRFASIIDRYEVTIFKAGATFLKTIMLHPDQLKDVQRHNMRSLKIATFCAEPVSPAIQEFAMKSVTKNYINSYWSTEHGAIVWSHPFGNVDFPVLTDASTYPLPWVFGDVWTQDETAAESGGLGYSSAECGERGEIVISRPLPHMARTIWGDLDNLGSQDWRGDVKRFASTYFREGKDFTGENALGYVQGDLACKYSDGRFTLHGRSDEVINVSGHRIGTEEIEGAILKDKQINPATKVGNCIVVGAADSQKGLVPLAFVVPTKGERFTLDDEIRLSKLVKEEKGSFAVPSDYIYVTAFPETRSGKYMRRVVKEIVSGHALGDLSALRNPECVQEIVEAVGRWRAQRDRAETQDIFETMRTLQVLYSLVSGVGEPPKYIATITINNPPVNALSERLMDDLETVLAHIDRRPDIGAVVLASKGAEVFVAGADVKQLKEKVLDYKSARALSAKAHRVASKIELMKKPVIAAVDGAALGGGNELALACHLRVAGPKSVFGQPEINLFLPPGYGATQRLPRILLGMAVEGGEKEQLILSLSMMLSGRQISSQEALRSGLVDYVCSGRESSAQVAQGIAAKAALNINDEVFQATLARHQAVSDWERPCEFPAEILSSPYIKECMGVNAINGRAKVSEAIIALVQFGFEKGFSKGLQNEIDCFAKFLLDEEHGGKYGISLFLQRQSPPLPCRISCNTEWGTKLSRRQLVAEKELLPVGSPFVVGVTKVPLYQYGYAVCKDLQTGKAIHGDPIEVENEVLLEMPEAGVNQALIYVLASEVNFNDVWAMVGAPISPFDDHDRDFHVTGSGGVGVIVSLGEGLQAEGRLAAGDVVSVYPGVSDILAPLAGADPMRTNFNIQGYQTPDGSHQQFIVADGPQLFRAPNGLSIEAMGSYMLSAGTAYRAIFRALSLKAENRLFVEGAASGTGAWAAKIGLAASAKVTGLVSSASRKAKFMETGAQAIDRLAPNLANSFTPIPENPKKWSHWAQEGECILDEVRQKNDGKLFTHAISHAGAEAFPRTFQALEYGGTLAFFGASSGHHLTFLGKEGSTDALTMLDRSAAKPGHSAVVFYGSKTDQPDLNALSSIEACCKRKLRVVVITDLDTERDFIQSLGYGDAVLGVLSIEEMQRREPEFRWHETMPMLPKAESVEFKKMVRSFSENSLKPIGKEVAKFLKGEHNPKGQPDVIFERSNTDSLFLSTMLIKEHTGAVLYTGGMQGRRYSFYAPQVWMRQRSILMPFASIVGSHLCSSAEILSVNQMIDAGSLHVDAPFVGEWAQAPALHQAMWENRLQEYCDGANKAVINHALPCTGLKTLQELQIEWSKQS